MNQTVSLLTITQFSRSYLFNNLIDMVNSQDYPDTIEWIIVEGSKMPEMAELNKQNIMRNKHLSKIPIKYIEFVNVSFAEKFNIGNNATTGNIIVIMEDDDYYPTTRVSHAVQKLTEQTDCLIAGCSPILVYDTLIETFYQFHAFSENHSCNNSFAYFKKYLEQNKFDGNVNDYTIEKSFTNHFRNQMVQLDPQLTIIHMFHLTNTINKYKRKPDWLQYNILKNIKEFPMSELEKPKFDQLVKCFVEHTLHQSCW